MGCDRDHVPGLTWGCVGARSGNPAMGLQIGPSGGTIYTLKIRPFGQQWRVDLHSGRSRMRNCLVLALVVLFAVTAFAQQTVSSSSSASGASAGSGADREPLASPRPKDFWDGDDPNLVNLITHPFANKKYVQRQVTPIRDRINELEQITSENSRSIKDVDTRAQQGIQLASEKASLADQHASDAANKAQQAQTAATQASTRVSSAEQMGGS